MAEASLDVVIKDKTSSGTQSVVRNLGKIEGKLNVLEKGSDKNTQALSDLSRMMKHLSAESSTLGNELKKISQKSNFADLGKAKASADAIKEIKSSVKDLQTAYAEVRKAYDSYATSASGYKTKTQKDALKGIKRELDRTGKALTDYEVKANSAMTRASTAIKKHESAVGKATKSIASKLMAMATAYLSFRSLSRLFKSIVEVTSKVGKAFNQLDIVLHSTNYSAGLTASEITKMAKGMSAMTTFKTAEIVGMQNILLTFKAIKGDTFRTASMAVLDLATALGGDLRTNAIRLGKALQDPIRGVTALRRVGVQLSEAQTELVKHFTKTGQIAKAQEIILQEVSSQVGGSATGAVKTLDGAVKNVKKSWAEWLNITDKGQIQALTANFNALADAFRTEEVKELKNALVSLATEGIGGLASGLKKLPELLDNLKPYFNVMLVIAGLIEGGKVGSLFGGPHGAVIGGGIGAFAGLLGGAGVDAYGMFKDSKHNKTLASASTTRLEELKNASKYKAITELIGKNSFRVAPQLPTLPTTPDASELKARQRAEEQAWRHQRQLDAEQAKAVMEREEARRKREADAIRYQQLARQGSISDLNFEYNTLGSVTRSDYVSQMKGYIKEMEDEGQKWSSEWQSAISSVVGAMRSELEPQLALLADRFSNGQISVDEYKTSLETLKDQYREYPILIQQITDAQDNAVTKQKTFIEQMKILVEEANTTLQTFGTKVADGLADAFSRAIVYGDSLSDTLKKLAQDIAYTVLKATLMKYVFGPMFGATANAHGNIYSSAGVEPYAKGGVVTSPTYFPFAKGIGLMGEAGTEAIMPLTRNSNGDLGVKADRQSDGGNYYEIHIDATDAQSFDRMLQNGQARIVSIIEKNIKRNGSMRFAVRGAM